MPQSKTEINKRYYKKNYQKILKRGNEWRRKNPDNVKNIRLKTRYGITLKEYDNVLAFQKGLCAICGLSGKLLVDHDHLTGIVRGLLCFHCNSALGHFNDKISSMEKAIFYLKTKKIYD